MSFLWKRESTNIWHAGLTTAYIKGDNSQKIAIAVKHYTCNNQEQSRWMINVKIDERALREIYLPGFKASIIDGASLAVMGAYNKVNKSYKGIMKGRKLSNYTSGILNPV